jgi:hypothetical protein
MGRRSQDNPIDWKLIEKEFRLGQSTLRQLASTHGVQPSAISRKAKREGWVQDKSGAVKSLSEAQLLISNNRKATAKATKPTTEDIEVAATVRTNIVLAHRGDAQRARALTMALLGELEHQTASPELYELLYELLGDPVDSAESATAKERRRKHMDSFQRAMSLGSRTATMKSLAESLQKVVAIEREAFGIELKGEGEKPAAQYRPTCDISELRAKFKAAQDSKQ